jgi:superfamily II DNA or RNA helicase
MPTRRNNTRRTTPTTRRRVIPPRPDYSHFKENTTLSNECDHDNFYNEDCNTSRTEKEMAEEEIEILDNTYYPTLNDSHFNEKIAKKTEFASDVSLPIPKTKKKFLALVKNFPNQPFVIQPHQNFVKNFLSSETPYNSLLLYHGLGTGKTCCSIGVCEEMREYYKQYGLKKKIIIVGSFWVIQQFKKQLFNPSQLSKQNGQWKCSSCLGNKFIDEINPTKNTKLSEEDLIRKVNGLITSSYTFYEYQQWTNKIKKFIQSLSPHEIRRQLQKEYDGTLIVIDEIHNIRSLTPLAEIGNENAYFFELLVRNTNYMRLLFLSGTPIFNDPREIIWLLNILNMNDKRAIIMNTDEVFDNDGFLTDNGQQVLIRKSRGYISFVKGENPLFFANRIYPILFAPLLSSKNENVYRNQFGPILFDVIANELHTSCHNCGDCQRCVYKYLHLTFTKDIINDRTSSINVFKYNQLRPLLQSLIITYPPSENMITNIIKPVLSRNVYADVDDTDTVINMHEKDLNEHDEENVDNASEILYGLHGLKKVVTFVSDKKSFNNFQYLENQEGFFQWDGLAKYSTKIAYILHCIDNAEGIILIYSQFLEGGLIPMALALEERGYRNYEGNHLFNPLPQEAANGYSYAFITADTRLSISDLDILTDIKNKEGHLVKVILTTRAGSEGLDLKYVRQLHEMEPWMNPSGIEQIIGRGLRYGSHQELPYEKRNIQIFLHGTILDNQSTETLDMFLYRHCSQVAFQLGTISRLLKENAVDCHMTQEYAQSVLNIHVSQQLSNKNTIKNFYIGHTPFSFNCDYMRSCTLDINQGNDEIMIDDNDTYNVSAMKNNMTAIIHEIEHCFQLKYFYTIDSLVYLISLRRPYPILQIHAALEHMVEHEEMITDPNNKFGKIIRIGDYYIFQPIELTDTNASVLERQVYVPHTNNTGKQLDEEDIHDIRTTTIKTLVTKVQKTYTLVNELRNNRDNITNGMYRDIIGTKEQWIFYVDTETIFREIWLENINEDKLMNIFVFYIMENLSFAERLDYVKHVYRSDELTDVDNLVKKYFDFNTFFFNGKLYLYLFKNKKLQLFKVRNKKLILDNSTFMWNTTDIYERLKTATKMYGFYKKNPKNSKITFHLQEEEKCQACESLSKTNIIRRLQENIRVYFNDAALYDFNVLSKKELCLITELMYILLLFNTNNVVTMIPRDKHELMTFLFY